jgi:cytochrome c peroxidase
MHDGSIATLEDVVAHYVRGGAGSQRQNPLVKPLDLTVDEQAALVAFLRALTDHAFLAR